jgi:hypothetical protein
VITWMGKFGWQRHRPISLKDKIGDHLCSVKCIIAHEALLLRCGSSIAEEPGTRPGIIVLNVGTFDQPAVAKPGREIFRDDALPWVEVQGEISRKTAG